MKAWGLATVGSVSRSFLPRISSLPRRLGPVASTSHRLAARIANVLKAGVPVKNFAALHPCPVIMLCAPGAALRLAAALASVNLDWKGKIVLICDSNTYSCDFPKLLERGALIASLNSLENMPGRYLIEGHAAALREARILVRDLGGKAYEIETSRVRLFDAARTLASSLFTPLAESCTECLRQAGVPSPQAALVAEAMLQKSLRAFMHSGRKSWTGPIARSDRTAVDRERAALTAVKPLLGQYFRSTADFAFDLYATFPELTRYRQSRMRHK